ncbi:tripartite motif-containing protein 45-like [Ostrea edulis]|uniref:tripartite motif-containing protein 45-like n=1 Tax=Ostrea edulis TaxID=37623 RepID=UPI0024AFFE0A|nr:tripartite motif-containing protein 45-like [Ostrea edulis]
MLHPRRSAQDVLLCDSCKIAPLQSHCERCNIHLCTNCVGKHLLDSSRKHRVVPFIEKSSSPNYPKCPKHADKHCEFYCEKCDVPVCSTCVLSDKHRGHKISDVLKKLGSKTHGLQKDLEELEAKIYSRYEEMASDVQTEKAELETNYRKLTTDADQQGEVLHREITAIVNQRKSDIAEMKNKHMAALDQNTDEITHSIIELKQAILNLKAISESKDISLISTYKSRNNEFRRLPPKVRVTLPSFSPQKISKDQLNEIFGSLSSLSITKELDNTMKSPESVSSPVKTLLDKPRITATIDAGYTQLLSVNCLSEDQVWTYGYDKITKLLNLRCTILTSIQTESRYQPRDIAATRDGYLVYTDPEIKTVNLVKNNQIQTVITLQGWKPRYMCSTASDDLLVIMISDD